MPIYVWSSGRWKVGDNVYLYGTPPGQRRRVIAAYLYQTNPAVPPPTLTFDAKGNITSPPKTATRHKLFDFTTPPPAVTGLVGVSPVATDPNHHTRATVSWTGVPAATTGYKIHRWEPATTGGTTTAERNPVDVTVPAGTTSYVFTGLVANTTYNYRVTYTNEFQIQSLPSKTITLKTGMAKVVATSNGYPSNPPATGYVPLRASSSDTWTKGSQWGSAYKVFQGYLSSTAERGYGCINYYNGYGNVAAELEKVYAAKWGAGIGKAILDHLGVAAPNNATVVDATFSRVTQRAGCSAGENVVMYPANFSYSSTTQAPVSAGSSTYFDAPGPGNMKHNFRLIDNTKLILWATNLVKKTQVHNGLMIYRSDTTNTPGDGYAGYCVLQSKSDSADTDFDLRINVWFKFSFTFKPYVAPVWS